MTKNMLVPFCPGVLATLLLMFLTYLYLHNKCLWINSIPVGLEESYCLSGHPLSSKGFQKSG